MHSGKGCARAGAIAVTGGLVLALLSGSGAGAQQLPTIEIAPRTPQPGRVVTVTGECFFRDFETGQLVPGDDVDVMLTDEVHDFPGDAYEDNLAQVRVPVADDFTWTASLTVPEDIAPGTPLHIVTQCLGLSGIYQTGSFGVGLPPSATSTTTPPSPGGPASPPALTPADAAEPVEAQPRFTG